MNRLECLDEGILRQIRRVLAIRRHIVDDSVNALAVLGDQPIKGRYITSLHLPDNFQISVRFLPALGRRNERLTENFGRFDHDAKEAYRSTRSKSKLHEIGARRRGKRNTSAPSTLAAPEMLQSHQAILPAAIRQLGTATRHRVPEAKGLALDRATR